MLNFVKKAFRGFLELSLWLVLIICGIAGYGYGHIIGQNDYSSGHEFIGLIIGLIML
jgi:hypothetical protein